MANKPRPQKTSFNIHFLEPGKYGSAYKHQKLEHRATLNYIHSDRSHLNESWHREYQANGHPKTLRNYLADVKKVVKAKTTKSMQKKAESKVIGEAVVVIDEQTTMDDLQKLGKAMEDRFGWTCVQIHIHRDEGYLGRRTEEMKHREGKYNLHAHMFFITTNLSTGKSWKMKVGDGSAMQDITAKALNLTRGEKKGIGRSKERLRAMEYKEKQLDDSITAKEAEVVELSNSVDKKAGEVSELQKELVEIEGQTAKKKEETAQLNKAIRDAGAELYTKYTELEDLKERKTIADLLQTMGEVADAIANYLTRQIGDMWHRYLDQWRRWYKGNVVTELDKIGVWFGRSVSDQQFRETYTADRSAGDLLINGVAVPELERRQQQNQRVSYPTDKIATRLHLSEGGRIALAYNQPVAVGDKWAQVGADGIPRLYNSYPGNIRDKTSELAQDNADALADALQQAGIADYANYILIKSREQTARLEAQWRYDQQEEQTQKRRIGR